MSWVRCIAIGAVAAQLAVIPVVHAETILSTTFSVGYTGGALVGQNNWGQTGSTTTSPIQVTSGSAVLGTSGQDAYQPFSAGAYPLLAGQSLLTRIDFNPSSVQTNGDYFFHLSDPLATASNFYQRLFARLVSGSVQLGLSTISTSATYGSGLFPIGQPITAVMQWNVVSGAGNDLINLFVNPSDPTNPSGAPYASASSWSSAEPTSLAAVNLRQGNSSNAPAVTVSQIIVTSVPEPETLACVGVMFTAIGAGSILRRRKAAHREPAPALLASTKPH